MRSLACLLLVGCHHSARPPGAIGDHAIPPATPAEPTPAEPAPAEPDVAAAPEAPPPELDTTDDVALILAEGQTCTWSLYDARSRTTKTVLVTDSCPETAVFDPWNQVTYFQLFSDVYAARWSERTATKLATVPNDREDAHLFVTMATGGVRIGLATDLTAKVVKNGKTFYRFEDKLFPEPPYNNIPVAVELFDLDDKNGWKRVLVTPSDRDFDRDAFRDISGAIPKAGTFTLREMLLRGDCETKAASCTGRALDHDNPVDDRLRKDFPASNYDENETDVATIALDDTHHLMAGTFAVHEVRVGSPLYYCKDDDCTRRVRLSAEPDRNNLDWRTWSEHTPLYIGVREGVALVAHMVLTGHVAFYGAASPKPLVEYKSAVAAWAPLRRYWSAQ